MLHFSNVFEKTNETQLPANLDRLKIAAMIGLQKEKRPWIRIRNRID